MKFTARIWKPAASGFHLQLVKFSGLGGHHCGFHSRWIL